MTAKEVCDKYKITETTLKTKFNRTQDSIFKKYGVKLIKEGRGESAIYREEIVSDNRAETMFIEVKPVINSERRGVMKNDLSLSNFTFCVFLGVVTTPMLVFRGTHKDFLNYIQVANTEDNIKKLEGAINDLVLDGVIMVMRDTSTAEEVLTLTLIRKAENDMKIGLEMLIDCKLLSSKHRKKDWIPLLKTWIGIELLSKKEIYTRQELMEMTGLSDYMIGDNIKILKESNIFTSSKAYSSFNRCIGVKSTMNNEGFYELK